MRLMRIFTASGIALMLAACAWNPFAERVDPRTQPAQLSPFQQTRQVKPVWSLSVGPSASYLFAPVASFDSIYAASAKGTILRVDPQNGREIWRIDARSALTAGVGTDGHTVVVAAKDGVLLAFDSEGKKKWQAKLSTEALSSPAVSADVVVVRTQDNRIYGFDTDTGERKWMVTRRLPPLTLHTISGAAISGPTAVVALPGGRMISLLLSNGATNWDVVVGDPRGTTDLERIADTSGVPAIMGRLVCAVSFQGRVACYDVVSGGIIWARELSSAVGVSIDSDFVYAASDAGAVYAFSNLGGHNAWRNDELAYRGLTTPVSFLRSVVVGDFQGFVHFLSLNDGAFVARVATDGSPIKAPPLVVHDKVILQTTGGRLAAFTFD